MIKEYYKSWFSESIFKVYKIVRNKVIYKRIDNNSDTIYTLNLKNFKHEFRMYQSYGLIVK